MATMNNRIRSSGSGLVLRLAWKDLCHEWILSLCLVMAVAAVLGPLFILFGLKFGSIELLRNRLMEDPRNREIRPMISTRYQHSWFEAMANRSDVAFVVPMTRRISTAVKVCQEGVSSGDCLGKTVDVDLLPTGGGDPLLLENNGITPRPDQGVLTQEAAEKLGVRVGDRLLVSVKRIIQGRYQKAELQLQVAAILDSRSGTTRSLYVDLHVLEAVERYKDGAAVPEYGWPGTTPKAYSQLDGLVIWVPVALSKLEQLRLKNNTGFSVIKELDSIQSRQQVGFTIGAPGSVYLLSTVKKAADSQSQEIVSSKLRGKHAIILPWVRPLSATFLPSEGKPARQVTLIGLGYGADIARRLQITPVPPWTSMESNDQGGWLQAFVGSRGSTRGHLTIAAAKNSLEIDINVQGEFDEQERVYVPAELAGIGRLLDSRPVVYDSNRRTFVLIRQGYAGFRLYAESIDHVDNLQSDLEKSGISVVTQAERIRDVRELNHYLGLIFWLIAAASALGGAATLAASLYASIERKRRDISILRLVGLSRLSLLGFPLYQGILLSFGGWLVASAFFAGLAWLINRMFSTMLQSGEYLCILHARHMAVFALVLCGVAIVSSLAASWRITRMEPVEALRDE